MCCFHGDECDCLEKTPLTNLIRKRFDDALTDYLLQLKWWDWDPDRIFRNMEALCSENPEKIRAIPDAAPPAK